MFKIAFSGAQNCGKTTKAFLFLHTYFNLGLKAELIPEVSRMCPFPLDFNAGFKTEDWVTATQIRLEREALLHGVDVLICDRSILDPLMYSRILLERGGMTFDEVEVIRKRVADWVHTYDAIVLCREYPMVEDGVRVTDLGHQRRLTQLFDEAIVEYQLTNVRRT